ncbi:MAG: 5-formyltetrahydrofolate cyclo-ligase [Bacteriovoracaceae bacterium]|nr:5-formyltetrahydrofolate cyclo-ligase [Bacteriovoracaceae bacterium]
MNLNIKSKEDLRTWAKSQSSKKLNLSKENFQLSSHLKQLFQTLGAGLKFPLHVAAFFPTDHEPKILNDLWNDDRFSLAFPEKMRNEIGPLHYLKPARPQRDFVHRLYNAKEKLYYLPTDDKELKIEKIPLSFFPLVLVPGLAFSYSGHRLGRGQGHYDRVLSQYCGIKIGICYEEFLLEDCWEISAHDQQMDYIVTEKQIISCKYF